MNFLVQMLVVSAVMLAVCARSAPLPPKKTSGHQKVRFLEVPAAEEMPNVLDTDREAKQSDFDDLESTTKFEIVVPVARNFSSLQELFKILKEDDGRSNKRGGSTDRSYVKGSEAKETDFMFFFTDV